MDSSRSSLRVAAFWWREPFWLGWPVSEGRIKGDSNRERKPFLPNRIDYLPALRPNNRNRPDSSSTKAAPIVTSETGNAHPGGESAVDAATRIFTL